MSIKPSLRLHSGTLSPEYALLGFLLGGPDHGYELHQRFTAELGQVWHLSQSQSYAILKRLEAHGDIDAEHVKQEKHPARQRLRITPAGRKRFMAWLVKGCGGNARSIRLEFLTRLYFAHLYAPEQSGHIYSAQMEKIREIMDRLEDLLQNLPPEQTYNRFCLDLRLRQMMLIRQWMAEIKEQFLLENGPLP